MNLPDDKNLAAKRLQARNRALLGLLVAFVVLIYAVTMVKVHP